MKSARTAIIVYGLAVVFPAALCVFVYLSTGRFFWGTLFISILFVRSLRDSLKDYVKYRRLAIEAEAEEGNRTVAIRGANIIENPRPLDAEHP